MTSVGDRHKDILINIALCLVDLLDDRIGVTLYAVGLAFEGSHGILEGALLEVTLGRAFVFSLIERYLHGEHLKETLLGSLEIVVFDDVDHTIP